MEFSALLADALARHHLQAAASPDPDAPDTKCSTAASGQAS
ncbi:hypothetical protein ABZ923_12130 [Streptomyces sp. NPDC046881]